MPLSGGDKLGPYEILALIGTGGMGQVWKARDTRLNRIVAIKVSSTEFSERFEREARAVAALNHPNICQLYDVGTLPEGGGYLVMEYIEGTPIAFVDSPRTLLALAIQLADGMAAAHAAGFTHRDLKPDNVLVTGQRTASPGCVKILDFGLAKRSSVIAEFDATQTMADVTNPGTVLGTVAYMSPEQARGEEVDARSDQFSFGLIVYEMASHKRAFIRGSAAETMTAIIRDEAEPLPPPVPAPLRWVVERCLAKDPAERYDSTRDLYRELKQARERLSKENASGAQTAVGELSTVRRPRWRIWVGAALIALAGFGKFASPLFGSGAVNMHIHPGGKFVGLILNNGEFWKLPLAGGELELVRILPEINDFAFWNDEQHILALNSLNESSSDLEVMDLASGASRRVFSVGNQGMPAITPDGRILALPLIERGYDVIDVPLDGSQPRDVIATPRNEVAPSWSPDGSRFAYVTNRSGRDQLWLRNRSQGLEQLIAGPKDFPGTSSRDFLDTAISPDGTRVAYRVDDNSISVWISPLSGDTPVRLWNDPAQVQRGAAWSPDGAWIAFYGFRDGRNAISKARVGGSVAPDLITYTSEPQPVRWSPDGTWIAYRDGPQLLLVSPDGQQKRVLSRSKWETYGWSKDSMALYGIITDAQHHHILVRLDVAAARETKIADYGLANGSDDFAYLGNDFPYRGFSLHPDGKSFLTSIYRAKSQIYLLRDFDRPARLIDRWLGK